MIPKTIHYCWFGHNPKPKLAEKCIRSWKRYCPDYEIIEWNEENFDISSAPLYVRQAFEAKKWAFVTDYVRLDIVYRHGGIYLDTDVELIKPLDPLLQNKAYFGLESPHHINTGLGFGAEKGILVLKEMLATYQAIPFLLSDGGFDETPCPDRNTEALLPYGFIPKNEEQLLDGRIHVYPTEYFCPLNYYTREMNRTETTYSIHWYAASWLSEEELRADLKKGKQILKNKRRARSRKIIKKIIGERCYQVLKDLKKKYSGFCL